MGHTNFNPSSPSRILPEAPAPAVVAIDDDPMVLFMIARALRAEGMACLTATDGAEGLRLIREHPPDLVLLDIVMSGGDGFSVCREIRQTWSAEQLPVVMVTGLEDLASIQAAYQAGANDFLTKPLHWKHLPFRIRHVLQANQAFRALQDNSKTLTSLFSVHPDSIFSVAADGTVTLVHSSYHHPAQGWDAPLGKLETLLPGPLAAQVQDRCRAALAAPAQVFSLESALPLGDDLRYWEGRFIASTENQVLVMVRDMTERRRSEQALHDSEERYQRITEAITDYIYTVRLDRDSAGQTVHGPGCFAVTGYSPDELARDPFLWIRMVADEDRPAVLEQVRRILAGEDPPPIEHRLRHKNGTVRWVRNTFVPHRDARGELAAYDGLVQDITERKRVEEALRESNQRLELAVQSGSLGIWDLNLQDRSAIWNDRMFELYGLPRAAVPPAYEAWSDSVVHPEDRAAVKECMRAALEEDKRYEVAFRVVLPDGEIRHIASTGLVVRTATGRAIRVLGVNRDRTEQVRAELERRRLQEERQHSEKLESLGSLAGGMAHDMNNVLAAIMGMASALRAGCTDQDPRAQSLDSILHASGRGRDLVKALTDFARKGLEEPHWFDLNEILRKEADLLGHARLRQIDLVLDLDPALPKVLGDASALGSAIMNLGINALDAMPSGGTLRFRSRALADGSIRLEVSDTGQGMTPEVLARAMEPFYTTKPVGKGTGLGLARVYGTVKAHGGTLELQSEPGRGTTVRILFPADPAAPPAVTAEPSAEGGQRPLHVLLVDDDDLIQGSTHALLDILGHDTVAVYSGEEALARLEAGYQPDIVLLDMNMPGLGGAGTLPRLRLLRPGLPVLLATGRADQSALDLVRGYPKVKLLSKPFGMKELRHQLETFGRGREPARP
jgi:PAS domain S-box-containing protein